MNFVRTMATCIVMLGAALVVVWFIAGYTENWDAQVLHPYTCVYSGNRITCGELVR